MPALNFLIPVSTVVSLATAGPSPSDSGRAAAVAVVRTGAITIDGIPNELAWDVAPAINGFIQAEPREGAPATSRTEVKVLFDDLALYVSAILYESDPSRIARQMVRRDEEGQYDWFEVSLSPSNDLRTGYRFRVSAAGVQRDQYLYDDVREDTAWDAVWQSAVARHPEGWSVEIRIPLSQLRYTPSDRVQSWGVNFGRQRVAAAERSYFSLESRMRFGRVSVFGQLDSLMFRRNSGRLELRPYVLGDARTGPAAPGNPFFDGSRTGTNVGLNLRSRLGRGVRLDATFNPDFGQVEVDPAVVNLTAFETFFPERRPFFVEDTQIFEFTMSGMGARNRLFYTRRIGRAPQGGAPSGLAFADLPTQTTILGAAKLTGRTAGGTSFGVIAALTDEEFGRALDTTAAQERRFAVEPRALSVAARLRQDFRGGRSTVGVLGTLLSRDLPEDRTFHHLASDAYGLGVNFEHLFGGPRGRDWALVGYLAGTHVTGDSVALIRIQRSSNHYFQRPDATRFRVDSTRTSMTGFDWRLTLERRSARHWTGAVWLAEVTSGFEVNDLGFSTNTERLDGGARLSYQEVQPGPLLRSYRLSLFTYQNFRHEALDDPWSFDSWRRAHKRGGFNFNADVTLLNYWELDINAGWSADVQSDGATRGGPLMTERSSNSVTIGLVSDRRRRFAAGFETSYRNRHGPGEEWRAGVGATLRPTPAVLISVQPSMSVDRDPAQYVAATGNVGYAPTFGRRYLFADLDRRTFGVETRLNVAMSPRLTLQMFAQPLLSSGRYRTIKSLERPSSFSFDVFEPGTALDSAGVRCVGGRLCSLNGRRYLDFDGNGTADHSVAEPDFNIRDLRFNAVLRWEYRPGSALFIVWQQTRRDRVTAGDFDLGRDTRALWGAASDNVFMVKLTYWLGL